MNASTGIHWIGPIFDRGGYGNVSRNCLLGLAKIGVPVRAADLFGVNPLTDHSAELDPVVLETMRGLRNTRICGRRPAVIHASPDWFGKAKVEGARVSKRIGYTIFETDRVPGSWVGRCRKVDEVWVPSRFNLETFASSGVPREKIRVVPYGLDTDFFRPIAETFPIPGKRGFCFLYVFMFDWRKGFDLLLEAYLQEFSRGDDVTLVLKAYGAPGVERDIQKEILSSVPEWSRVPASMHPHVVILDAPLTQESLKRLYNTCDLYISTDRANGWGMPCMEAMAMGKPAATIDWSGSTEFMTEENSLLIRPTGKLVPVDERLARERPIYAGHRWAEVSVDEVRRVMRFAVTHRDRLDELGSRGRNSILNGFSLTKAAERLAGMVRREAPPWHERLFGCRPAS